MSENFRAARLQARNRDLSRPTWPAGRCDASAKDWDCTVRLRRVKGGVLSPRRNRSPAQICERIRPPIHRLSALSLASSLCNEQDGAAGCVYCRDHRRLATGRSMSKHKVAVTLCDAADSLQLARLRRVANSFVARDVPKAPTQRPVIVFRPRASFGAAKRKRLPARWD